MKRGFKQSLRSYAIEFLVYGALVTAYYFLVLHFLGGWLHHIFQSDRALYSAVALGLIVGQGLLLEMLTRFLLGLIKHTE